MSLSVCKALSFKQMGVAHAALTAFLVQYVQADPAFTMWIALLILFALIISITIRKFQKGKPFPIREEVSR